MQMLPPGHEMAQQQPRSSNELAQQRTDLAEDRTELASMRTVMAADRSLMAWIRTGLSMISFGFTIYKALNAFEQAGGNLPRDQAPRNVGLFLTALGTVAILMGTVEYWHTLAELKQPRRRVWRPSLFMALIMSITGLVLFALIVSGTA
jgi:putative membrane protein